jgi:acetyl-CoA carboxylase carboxyl transferase subunit beta
MAWFRKDKKPKPVRSEPARSHVPEGLWVRCEDCREIVYGKELDRNLRICPKCGYHFRIDAPARVRLLLDEPAPRELFRGVRPTDPLKFRDTRPYADRLRAYQEAVGVADAVLVVEGTIDGIPVVAAVMDYRFMGGSMGSVVGEKITRAVEHAVRERKPLLVVSASGGARMQEGILSLMQMAKISAALALLREARIPSFAMLGDLNVAEPGALIGFAGPRVIEQTIRQSLPDGFQRSEFLLEHGFVDLVVKRSELKETLARCLRHLAA